MRTNGQDLIEESDYKKITNPLVLLALTGSFALVCGLTGCQPPPPVVSENNDSKDKVSKEIWKDDKAQMNRFVDDLMNKMTLEEKMSQMTLFASSRSYHVFTVAKVWQSALSRSKRFASKSPVQSRLDKQPSKFPRPIGQA